MDSVSFDPAMLSQLNDPFPRYAELRAVGRGIGLVSGGLAVFGYDAADFVLRDPRFESRTLGLLYASALPPGALRDEMCRRINFLDTPDHPRVRGLVAKVFTPRRVSGLRPWIEATAQRLVDELVVVDGCVEIMHGLAHQLPSLVISELLGVPVAVRDRLTRLSDAITPVFGFSMSDSERVIAVAAAEEIHAILGAEVERRRGWPADDLLSALVAVEADGLSRAELMSLIATLYSAGHRTTRDLFGNGLELLLTSGVSLDETVDSAMVDEIARLATPTHYVARFAAEDVEVSGEPVSAGTLIVVFLAAANRDPAIYDRPDDYDPARAGRPALSFALGPHFCLGASLARMEVEVMLAAVAARFPRARASGAPRRWHQRGPFRGLDELVVRVD